LITNSERTRNACQIPTVARRALLSHCRLGFLYFRNVNGRKGQESQTAVIMRHFVAMLQTVAEI